RQLKQTLQQAREARARAEELVQKAREGSVWSVTWLEVRRVIAEGIEHALVKPDERARRQAAGEVADRAERAARGGVEYALKGVRAGEEAREQAEPELGDLEPPRAEAGPPQSPTPGRAEQGQAGNGEG